MTNKQTKFFYLFFGVILVFSLFLRFWKLNDWFYFMIDEGRDAFLIKRIIKEHRPVLIGPAVPGGIYLGPAYFYLSTPIYFLANLNPLGGAVFASFLGVFCTGLIYWVAKKLFSQLTAVFASLFYGFSYLVVIYNRAYWPLVFTPLFSLLTYFFLFQIIKAKRGFLFPLALLLAIATQCEPATFSLLLLSLLMVFLYRPHLKRKEKVKSLIIFFLFQIPLVLFDLRHNFFNFKAFIKLFSFGKLEGGFALSRIFQGLFLLPQTFSRVFWVQGLNDVVKQISPCDQYVQGRASLIPSWFLLVSLAVLAFFLINFIQAKKKQLGIKILGWHLIIGLLGISFYNLLFPGYTHEWFFYVFFPCFCLIGAAFFSFLWSVKNLRLAVILALVLFIFINFKTFFSGGNSYGFKDKVKAVNYAIEALEDNDFYLDSIGTCFAYGGYRYLFWLYGHEPTHSYMDHAYADWVYPQSKKDKPKLGVVIVNPADQETEEFYQLYDHYKSKQWQSKKFGQMEVLIVKDK